MLNQFLDVFSSLNSHGVKYLVIGGIASAGLGTALLTTPEELLKHEITIFRDRIRVDVQTATPGLVFAEDWQRKAEMAYKDQILLVVSRADLIASKRAAGRAIDLEDVRLLDLGT